MAKDELELRKEKIINFFSKSADFFKKNKHLIQYFLLVVILWLAVFIRKHNWNLLKDVTTGKYISLELDSTLFLRYAQYIAEHGRLFDIDMMRNFPFGATVDFGVFTSYFVAYLYKLLHLFSSSITVEFVDVIYPTVATVIAALFLFLFVRRLLDYRVALLSALFLVVSPTFLFRSISSDHDILGLMFVFMTLYFFVVGWQSKRIRYNILFGAFAAFTTVFSFHTAGNIRIFSVMIALFVLVHVFLDNVKKSDLYVYPTWFLVSGIALLTTTNMGFGGIFFDAFNTLPSTIAFFSLIIYLVLETNYVKNLEIYKRILKVLPKGVITLLLVFILGSLFMGLLFGFSYFSNVIVHLQDIISKGLFYNRWSSTVAENRRVFVVDWFSSFGSSIVWFFIIAFLIVIYRLFRNVRDHKKLFSVCSLSVLAFIFSRYSQGSILNGVSVLSKIMFYGGIVLPVVYIIYYYVSNHRKEILYNKKFYMNLDWHYSFLMIIALINVVGGTTAIRLFFELAPFIVIFSSFTIIFFLDYFLSLDIKIVKYAGVIFIFLLLFSPFSFAKGLLIKDYNSSLDQVKYSGPGYNLQWQKAGEWVRENTPKDTIFLHWWDYGYWVQSGFDRATVTDGGNRWDWWNYLTARYVLTAPRDEDTLGFMYSHNVNYLLVIGDEVGKYPAYSLIGSDSNFDRLSYITFMGMDPSLSKETRNETFLIYRGGFGLDEDFIFNGKLYPKGSTIAAVVVPVQKILDGNGSLIGNVMLQPRIALVLDNQAIELSLKCVYFDKLYIFDSYDYGGCVRIVPTVDNNQINNVGAVLFLSKRVAESLVGRLYILEDKSDYFELVFNDAGSVPLAMYGGRQIGPIKIWRVNYPEGFSVNETDFEFYTRTSYPDTTLKNF